MKLNAVVTAVLILQNEPEQVERSSTQALQIGIQSLFQ